MPGGLPHGLRPLREEQPLLATEVPLAKPPRTADARGPRGDQFGTVCHQVALRCTGLGETLARRAVGRT
ncbi:hypothetical protein STRAU_4373 [Streptomyces aurantiacus JA 4570]|uniref:Uncharacterized protein n=1 Tax=Streptomyces aurantiacus JA 4570 TaxID=1286094 RepID=S3ZFW5_9ACTN|nr:hypothetical protein STRAU_4373 [Streptomyces aurantiacus JA 4570]